MELLAPIILIFIIWFMLSLPRIFSIMEQTGCNFIVAIYWAMII